MLAKRTGVAISALLLLTLTACGSSTSDRLLSGAAIGGGAGAAGGAIFGAPQTGAAIGAAVGAATGSLTDQQQIDLGEPIWK